MFVTERALVAKPPGRAWRVLRMEAALVFFRQQLLGCWPPTHSSTWPLGETDVPAPPPPPRRSPESASPGCPRFCDLTFLEGGQCWCKSKSETQSSACKVGSGSWGQSELGEHWPLGHPSASDPEFIHASSLAVSLSSLSLSNSVISHRLPFPPDLPSWASGCPHGPALTPRRPCPP